ncbi:MAG TPA: hypothetical protein DEA26_09560, partial [Oceanospirillales bacterium]|nr:hypothetical protein [Oceanospirillales bacterium]
MMRILLTAALLTTSVIPSFTMADDTDVYTGSTVGTATPNVMMLIDTSGSMGAFAEPFPEAYDPTVTYDDSRFGFDPDGYYVFSAAVVDMELYNVSPIDNKTIFIDQRVADMIKEYQIDPSVIRCGNTAVYLATLRNDGYDFTNRWAFWRPGKANLDYYSQGEGPLGWTGPNKYVGYYYYYNDQDELPTVDSEPGHMLQCSLSGTKPYEYNGTYYQYMSYQYGDRPFADAYPHPTAYRYTQMFTGNYLNYISVVTESRMGIVRRAVETAMSQMEDINIGLATFDLDSLGAGIDFVIQPIEDVEDRINERLDTFSPWLGTPIAESLHEVYLYLSGSAPKYGDLSQDHYYFWGVNLREYTRDNSDGVYGNGFQHGHGLITRYYNFVDP